MERFTFVGRYRSTALPPAPSASPAPPARYQHLYSSLPDENANLGTVMRYEEIGEYAAPHHHSAPPEIWWQVRDAEPSPPLVLDSIAWGLNRSSTELLRISSAHPSLPGQFCSFPLWLCKPTKKILKAPVLHHTVVLLSFAVGKSSHAQGSVQLHAYLQIKRLQQVIKHLYVSKNAEIPPHPMGYHTFGAHLHGSAAHSNAGNDPAVQKRSRNSAQGSSG